MSDIPKISVLIPIYNVCKYLPACLDSVLSQTLRDMEIICINDGSTDGCGEILTEYAAKDLRIKMINKPNSGYGASMNMGLDVATGEYIGIVESDDEIRPDFYERLYEVAIANDLDLIKGECTFTWPSERYEYSYHASYLQKYFGTVIGKDRLWLRCQFLMNIWTGIYKRQMLAANDIRFNETPGASYQDNGFWMQCMIYADRAMFVEDNGYLYRQDNSAASVKDSRKVYAMVDEYEWMAEHLRGRIDDRQMDVVNAFRLIRGYWSFFRIADSMKREFCDRLISDYNKFGDVFVTDLNWQELYYRVISDPDGFCKKVIDAKKEIEEKVQSAESVIIYGAGARGQRLFRLFCDRGFKDRLQCYVETNAPVRNAIASVPIYQIGDSHIQWNNALVIISASDNSTAAKEMREKVSEFATVEVLSSNSFFDNYYMLT